MLRVINGQFIFICEF